MGLARVFLIFLFITAVFASADRPSSIVYGKVIKQYRLFDDGNDSLDMKADKKLCAQVHAGYELTLKQPDLPENVRYMLSMPPIDPRKEAEWNGLIPALYIEIRTVITQIQVLKVLDTSGRWVPVQDSTLKLYAYEDTTNLTYNIKNNHFYKFGPVAKIDSQPRVFRPHHFSRPVTEEELQQFPYRELSEYTRFQQYIQLDTLDAPPLYSTLLRLVQESKFDSIPPLLNISRQLREKYGKSPVDEIFLALLANDSNYFKNADPSEYSNGNFSFGSFSTLYIATLDSLTTPRLEEALKHVTPEARGAIRRNWKRYLAERRPLKAADESQSERNSPDATRSRIVYPEAVYGRVIERISSNDIFKMSRETSQEWYSSEIGKQFNAALEKYNLQHRAATRIVTSNKDIPENERFMFDRSRWITLFESLDPRDELNTGSEKKDPAEYFAITRIQVKKILDSNGKWVDPPKDSILNIFSMPGPTPEALTYNIKEGRFLKFGPIAVIDSQPRVFLRHHYSRPIQNEDELSVFDVRLKSEYTPYQQPIYMDSVDAPPLYSTALRYVQNRDYDSIPELLKIDRQLREKFGTSPIEEFESKLALLANDKDFLISSRLFTNIFAPLVFSCDSSSTLVIKLQEALLAPEYDNRFEDVLEVFPMDIRALLRVERAYAKGIHTYDWPLFDFIVQTNADSLQDENTRNRILNYLYRPGKRHYKKESKPVLGQFYLYFGGEGQLLMNGAQKVFNNSFQIGLNWMGVGGCVNSLCADYEVTYFFSKKTGEDHIVNDTLYNRENPDVRLSLLLEWRPFYSPNFDVRAYVGYHINLYSFKVDSDFEVDKKHQYNNIGDFGDISLGGMLNFSPINYPLSETDEGWKIYTGFRLKVGYIFLNTPEFNNLNGGGLTMGFYVYAGI